jgi:hypothetical protein
MDDDRLKELFREYRAGEISEEEWMESTTPRGRMRAVVQHGNLSDEEILTMEQLVIAAEIIDEKTAPDEVEPMDPEDMDGPDVYPKPDELPDDPPDIDDMPIADRIEASGEDATLMGFAWMDWIASTTPEERQQAVDRYGAPSPDDIPDCVDIPGDLDLSNPSDESE